MHDNLLSINGFKLILVNILLGIFFFPPEFYPAFSTKSFSVYNMFSDCWVRSALVLVFGGAKGDEKHGE